MRNLIGNQSIILVPVSAHMLLESSQGIVAVVDDASFMKTQ
jgi:hypothetical protein